MDPFSPEQQYEIQLLAEAFLKGQKEEIDELNSMRQVKELFNQMKNCYLKLKQDGKNILESEHIIVGDGKADSEKNAGNRSKTAGGIGIGDILEGGEFGLGVAPKDSRPVNKIELTVE